MSFGFPIHCVCFIRTSEQCCGSGSGQIRLDPFHFGQPDPDPDPFHETDLETDPGSNKSAKIMENFHKNQTKS